MWSAVAERLQSTGFTTIAPALPLRGLDSDAAYLSAFLDTPYGPLILVGHSYGGSVISHPTLAKHHLKALVFVSAFMPDSGECTGELNDRWPGSKLGEATTIVRSYPGGQDLYLGPKHFADVYAADLAPATVALMAAAQRPIDTAALGEAFHGSPAWRDVPSWAFLSTCDHSLPLEAQRFMAKRAGSSVVEIEASHATPVSQPAAVPPPCQITTTDQGCVAPAAPPSAPPVYANSLTPNSNAPSRHDAIAFAVRKQKGTVFVIRTPSDFAKAIERIAQ